MNTVHRTILLALAAVLLASASALAGEPLACMKSYKMKEFPVICWAFHNYYGTDYTDQYARDVAADNFNAVVDTGYMLNAYQKAGVKVFYYTGATDTLNEKMVWGEKRTHPGAKGFSDVPDLQLIHLKHGEHPALVGYVVQSNYGARLPQEPVEVAKWLADNKSPLLPWVAYCRDAKAHAAGGLNVLSIECFGRLKHTGFGYDNKGWAHEKRNGYLKFMEDGRRTANALNLAFWPLLSASIISKGHGDAPVGNVHGASEIRFQALAPLAYGAQGIVYFGYSTARPFWLAPNGSSYVAAKDVNAYVRDVAGPAVLGHRSVTVFATAPDAPPALRAKAPDNTTAPAAGQLIESMDKGALAGVLVSEANFLAKANTPAYVMLVDARTETLTSEGDLKPRELKLTFSPAVQSVEILPAAGEKLTQPAGREVKVALRPGDGRLLKLTLAPAK